MRSRLEQVLAHARVHQPLRRAFPNRSVQRSVQGVELWMPWSHRLPDYAALKPGYGQNLVDLAAALMAPVDSAETLYFLDVGANIGDSTKQVFARVPARALAIEADPYYLEYLQRNLRDEPNATIVHALLTSESSQVEAWVPERRGGTTHFVESGGAPDAASAVPTLSIQQLAAQFPEFAHARLIKSDTDGYDTQLIPELATVFRTARPVLFFEYDPALTSAVAGVDAALVWAELAELGYALVAFWDNSGVPLGLSPCASAAQTARSFLASDDVDYVDVAVVHAQDQVAQQALSTLLGEELPDSPPSTITILGSGESHS